MKIRYLAVMSVLFLSGCGSEEDIMGYTVESVAPVKVDLNVITKDPLEQQKVVKRTSGITNTYESDHREAVQRHFNKKQRLESEFKTLAEKFELECMTEQKMKEGTYCVRLRDNALSVDESIRKEKVRHIDELNGLKDIYIQGVNESINTMVN